MKQNNESMGRPAAAPKHSGAPHGYSLLAGLLVVISGMVLTGCGAAPPITQQVDIPVYVSCVKAAPACPTTSSGGCH